MLWSCFPDYAMTSLRHVPVFSNATNGRYTAAWAAKNMMNRFLKDVCIINIVVERKAEVALGSAEER